eukprot:9491576-Prorocentrum_lima.AAC.1
MAKHGNLKTYDITAKALDYIEAKELQAEGHPAAACLMGWARLVVDWRLPCLMEGWLAMGREVADWHMSKAMAQAWQGWRQW